MENLVYQFLIRHRKEENMPGQPGWQRRKNRKKVKASAKPDPKELKEDLITKYGPRPKTEKYKQEVEKFGGEQLGRRRRDDYTDGEPRIPVNSPAP